MAADYRKGTDTAGGRLIVRISDAQLAEVERTLAGVKNGARTAIRSAINTTLTRGRTALAREIREEVFIPYREILSRISIPRRATSSNLSGYLKLDYKKIPAIQFKTRASKSKGVSVHMLKSQSAIQFVRAFIATGRSQGRNVYERIKGAAKRPMTSGVYAGRKIKTGPRAGQPLLRQPLRRMTGISAVRVLEVVPGLEQKALANIGSAFQKQLASKIQWQLAKGKPDAPDFPT